MKKFLFSFLLVILFYNSLGIMYTPKTFAALPPGSHTIKDILAHDSNIHPTTIAEILTYINSNGNMPGRTGWSAYELICDDKGVWNKGRVTVTSDSGRDKHYSVSEYRSEIVSAYGQDMYDAALASGKKLQYQAGSKSEDPTGVERKWYPCNNLEKGGYYNNLDFNLTLTFTIGEVKPDCDPDKEVCPDPDDKCDPATEECNETIDDGPPPIPPPDLFCSIDTQVSETNGKSSTGANMTADPNGKITESHESSQFNVLQYGIPSSEYLKVNGQSEKYLADYRYAGMTGTVTYNFKVTKDYIYRWEDVSEEDEDGKTTTTVNYEHVRKEVPIQDPYNISYWLVGHLNVYGFIEAVFKNYALPNGQVTVQNPQRPTASGTHDPSTDAHVFPQMCEGVYLGEETIDSEPAGEPSEDISGEANMGSRPPDVKNDFVIVDGNVSMRDDLVSLDAPTPTDVPLAPQVPVAQTSLLIDPLKVNRWQTRSSITANYRSIFTINSSSSSLSVTGNSPAKINPVTVHTPVVMYARASDDKEHDQRTDPPKRSTPAVSDTDRHAFILDRPFTVSLPTNGQHLQVSMAPGYGNRDFAKYVREKQVKFPFDVYTETKQGFYPKNTWITVPTHIETPGFFLPVWVPEGQYTVDYRTVAINAPALLPQEHHANLNLTYRTPDGIMENHVANDTVEVDVVGRLYDFRVTDILDFQWGPVFRTTEGLIEHTGNYYWVGDKMIDGDIRGNKAPFTLPVRHGSHPKGYPNEMKNVAVKTGYQFKFDMKSKGNMWNSNDAVRIVPSFYFVKKNGTERRPVDVYYHSDSNYFVKIGSDKDKEYREVTLNEPLRNMEKKQLADTADFTYRHPDEYGYRDIVDKTMKPTFIRDFERNYSKKKTTSGTYSWQVLNWNLRTLIGPDANLVPTNSMVPPVDVKAREQQWYGEYSLPADIYVVDQGRDIAGYGVEHRLTKKSPIFLQDGYVIVNFNIETIDNGDTDKPRLQYHKGPLANQWKMEGFKYNFNDPYGNNFNLIDGDVLFYHGDNSSFSDFDSNVTH
ncbi:DUF5704 domain-containing protein (plasmid) [Sporosarcina psychrophila]|uniref:DUF5704 domain-containing protein n=1 Tax=Sporosarcina psychrophila TaxID=1476 RepID=UPI0030D609B4